MEFRREVGVGEGNVFWIFGGYCERESVIGFLSLLIGLVIIFDVVLVWFFRFGFRLD